MPLCLPGLPDGNSTRIYKRKCKEPVKNGTAPLKNGTAPHHLASQGSSPPRGSRKAADNFCLIVRKHDETRGSLDVRKRLTSFAEKNEGTEFFQARGRHAKTSSVGRSRQLPQRGSRERGLSIKRLVDEKMPDCCSAAPHHLALQGAGCRSCLKRQFGKKSPPRGSLDVRKGFTFLPKK